MADPEHNEWPTTKSQHQIMILHTSFTQWVLWKGQWWGRRKRKGEKNFCLFLFMGSFCSLHHFPYRSSFSQSYHLSTPPPHGLFHGLSHAGNFLFVGLFFFYFYFSFSFNFIFFFCEFWNLGEIPFFFSFLFSFLFLTKNFHFLEPWFPPLLLSEFYYSRLSYLIFWLFCFLFLFFFFLFSFIFFWLGSFYSLKNSARSPLISPLFSPSFSAPPPSPHHLTLLHTTPHGHCFIFD